MAINKAFPAAGYPIVDSSGRITTIWLQFFQNLFAATGGSSTTGNVQSVTVRPDSGIISSVDDSTTNAIINLSLGNITPESVTSSGQVSGSVGSFSGGLSTGGTLQFGVFQSASPTPNGYISINDASGTSRHLLVG